MLESIEKAIAEANTNEIRLNAHAIKGALNHLGARSSALLAEKIEKIGASQKIEANGYEIQDLLTDLKDDLVPVSSEMQEFVDRQ